MFVNHQRSQRAAGFPSPADDFIDTNLDLNKLLITKPTATYFMRVTSDTYLKYGIHEGDLLIIDRSKEPKSSDLIVGVAEGEFHINYYQKLSLDQTSVEKWGVITHIISQVF